MTIEMLLSATLFRAGQELQLQVQGRWFYARNPLTGQFPSYCEKIRRGRCIVHLGGDHATALHVPVQRGSDKALDEADRRDRS